MNIPVNFDIISHPAYILAQRILQDAHLLTKGRKKVNKYKDKLLFRQINKNWREFRDFGYSIDRFQLVSADVSTIEEGNLCLKLELSSGTLKDKFVNIVLGKNRECISFDQILKDDRWVEEQGP